MAFVCVFQMLSPLSLTSKPSPLNINDPRDFRLLGLLPGQTEFATVEERLGHTKHFYARRGIGARPPMVCYVASTSDHTRITFTRDEEDGLLRELWVTAGDFNFDFEESCSVSSLINTSVGTDGGLKLGMSKANVVALYGMPQATNDPSTVRFDADRPLTDGELRSACSHTVRPQSCTGESFAFYGEIECTFRKGRLVQFYVFRGITT